MKRIVLFCMVLLSGYANAQLTNITISKGIDNPTRIAVDDFSNEELVRTRVNDKR